MASGQFDIEAQKWVWEPVCWRKSNDGMWYSNRVIPEEYWKQPWKKQIKKRSAGVVMVRRTRYGSQFWMVRSYFNCWGFPKGKVEGDETFKQAAAREFYEETGTRVNLENSLEIGIHHKNVTLVFYVVVVGENYDIYTNPVSDHEITGFGWIPLDNIQRYKLSGITKKIFESYTKSPHTKNQKIKKFNKK